MKIVAAAIVRNGNKVLLARRGPGSKLSGKWEFPGGKVEATESLEDCLTRELDEELGVRVCVGVVHSVAGRRLLARAAHPRSHQPPLPTQEPRR